MTFSVEASFFDSICESHQLICCRFLGVYDGDDVLNLDVRFEGAAVRCSLSLDEERPLDPMILGERDKFGEVHGWVQTSDTVTLYVRSDKYVIVEWTITGIEKCESVVTLRESRE